MPIYYLNASVLSRTNGANSVNRAAYIARRKLTDNNINKVFNYSSQGDVVDTGFLQPPTCLALPESQISWVNDLETFWNVVEKTEKRPDSQVAREIKAALPVELSYEINMLLIKDYLKKYFVELGMFAFYGYHQHSKHNPHFHSLLTTRSFIDGSFGLKERAWNTRQQLCLWREQWASTVNDYLKAEGIKKSIDSRSYKNQKNDLGYLKIPTFHIGVINCRRAASPDSGLLKKLNAAINYYNFLVKKRSEKPKIKLFSNSSDFLTDRIIHSLQDIYDNLHSYCSKFPQKRRFSKCFKSVNEALEDIVNRYKVKDILASEHLQNSLKSQGLSTETADSIKELQVKEIDDIEDLNDQKINEQVSFDAVAIDNHGSFIDIFKGLINKVF